MKSIKQTFILVQASYYKNKTLVQASACTFNRLSVRFLRNLIVFVFIISSLQACGQKKVESKAYHVMLQGILSHSMEEVFVSDQLRLDCNIIYLDAREKAEYQVSHINKAIWVGYDDFNLDRVKELHKEDTIVVYCSVGYRSEKVAEKLKQNGFKNVTNLYGGIFEWKNQNLPIINSTGGITDSIHAYDKTWGIWLKKGIKVY